MKFRNFVIFSSQVAINKYHYDIQSYSCPKYYIFSFFCSYKQGGAYSGLSINAAALIKGRSLSETRRLLDEILYCRQFTDLGGNSGLNSPDSEILKKNRVKYVINPLIGYLNINGLRKKTVDLSEIILDSSLDYVVLSEAKSDDSFLTA